MLSRQEKQFAQQMFTAKIAMNDESTFACLFHGIMRRREAGMVRLSLATGGGRGNGEAYCTDEHHLYLLYSAWMVANRTEAVASMAKLLVRSHPEARSLFLVCNDRFRGEPKQLKDLQAELNAHFPNLFIDLFLPKELAELFQTLDDQATLDVIGHVPRPAKLVPVSPERMHRVIDRTLMYAHAEHTITKSTFPFERLAGHFPSLLDGAAAFSDLIDPKVHPELCRGLKNLYNLGSHYCPDDEGGNWIFCFMLDRLCDSDDPVTQSAALAVLASCLDIRMDLADSA